jgi:hypothetical protein
MLTGSFASSLHGLTRATQDIDLVIAPTENQLRELVRQLPSEDVILAKLEWATLGSSQRQIEDVAGILQLRFKEIDLEYVEAWKLAKRGAGIE